MAIAPFPHVYSVRFEQGELMAHPRLPIRAGSPPQFGGTDDVWSPEELLVASALLCLKTTFDAYARRERLVVRDWRGSGTGYLDKGKGGPVFTSIELHVELVTEPGEEERARAIVATAEKNCIITRALSAPVTLAVEVTSNGHRAPELDVSIH